MDLVALRTRAVVVAALAAALAVAWKTAGDFTRHVGEADPGFVTYSNAVVGPPWLSASGSAFDVAPLRMMDRVVAIDGRPVESGREVQRAAREAGPGRVLRYRFERPGGELYEADIPTRTFTEADLRELLLPFLLGGILLVVVGCIPALVRPELPSARIFCLWALTWVTNFAFLTYDYFFTYSLMPWNYAVSWLAKASLIHVGLTFPERRWPLTRWPRAAVPTLYAALALPTLAWIYAMERAPAAMFTLDKLAMGTFTLGLLLLAGNVAWTALRSQDVVRRQRARVVLLGPILIVAAWSLLLATAWFWTDFGLPLWSYIGIAWAFPLSVAYGMLKHNIFEFTAVVRRAITASALALCGALAYLGAFAGLQQVAGVGTAWASAALSAAILLALLPAVGPLRRRVESVVEELLFPDHRRAHAAIHHVSQELPRLREPAAVAGRLRQAIRECVRSERVRLVAGAPADRLEELAPEEKGLSLGAADPLRRLVLREHALNLDLDAGEPALTERVRARLDELGVRMVVPLPESAELVGLFLLGPRSDGRLYNSDDESYVETLAAQSGVAIEGARAFEEVALLQRRLAAENLFLREEIERQEGFEEIVGESPRLRAVLAQVAQVAPTDATVLISGETGTGKELIVRALHRLSRRAERPLVKVACAAVPETLLESELFGHERGAFTGASARRRGRFEVADGGTLLLDDVDTLPLGIQAKLLRALQEGEIQRLGNATVNHVDVRTLATTNRDLLQEVAAGRFREDLYYRLNVVPLSLPALRERREDIALLAKHFAARESERLGRPIRAISEEMLDELTRYAWPGNVRELRNVIERAVVLGRGDILHLPGPLAAGRAPVGSELDGRPLADLLREFKAETIRRALDQAAGNQRAAAVLLGLHPPSLSRMMRDLGLR